MATFFPRSGLNLLNHCEGLLPGLIGGLRFLMEDEMTSAVSAMLQQVKFASRTASLSHSKIQKKN